MLPYWVHIEERNILVGYHIIMVTISYFDVVGEIQIMKTKRKIKLVIRESFLHRPMLAISIWDKLSELEWVCVVS